MMPKWDRRSSRDLDSFEEFFFYLEDVTPALHFQVVTVEGETAMRDWQNAWQSLHAAYPLLRFRIIKEACKRPRFVETDRHARIEIEAGGPQANVTAEAERALAYPFTNPEKEVLSLRIVHSPTACVVSLASHHSLFDGMSTLLLLQDLLERVSGGAGRTQPPPWSSLRDRAGAPSRTGYRTTLTQAARAPSADLPGPAQVRHLVLDPLLTRRIEEVARQHGTTPHGALMAPSAFLAKVASSPITFELMITDYASYRPRNRFGSLQIKSLATGVCSADPMTQAVGVCTLGDAMNLTQISREPIDGFLDRCRELLVTVCA